VDKASFGSVIFTENLFIICERQKTYVFIIEDQFSLYILQVFPGRPGQQSTLGTTRHVGAYMAWLYLFMAGVFEIVWAAAMKESQGFTRLIPSITTVFFMILSFGLLAVGMKTLPLGTSYTIWVGIGAVGAFILGITLFGEAINAMRVIAALLIISGVILMKIATK